MTILLPAAVEDTAEIRVYQEWFSVAEIAEAQERVKLWPLPGSVRRIKDHIDRAGWDLMGMALARKRGGRQGGGGMEYHVSLLPGPLQDALRAEFGRALTSIDHAMRVEADTQRRAVLATTALTAHQRQVMDARAELLTAIESFRIVHGLSARQAIMAFVERPEEFGVPNAVIVRANDRINDERDISARTIQRWLARRQEGGVAALAPEATKEAAPLPEGFADFLTCYAKPGKPAITEALSEYNDKYPARPLTLQQVRYALKTKLNDIERNVGREGLLTLRSRMAYIQRSTENLFPTTIYTADGKTFDAEVAHPVHGKPFKPEITSILDVATRRCVGYAISLKENVIAVTEALQKACCAHGIPAIFYVDRGAGYKNKTFDGDFGGLMGRLAITKMHALPYNSQAKGLIERFNGSVWNPLARKLPTYLGESMDKEAAGRVHKATRSDIKLFGSSRLLPEWEDFRAMVEAAIATYNAAPHSGLPRFRDFNGRWQHYSPDQFWAQHVAEGFEPIPVDADMRDDLFRPYVTRTARRAMIEWNNNTYYHAELEAWHGEEVMVGYDFADASKVWVREIDHEEGQPGALICIAQFGGNRVDYVPKTYQRAAEERRLKGRMSRIERKRAEIEAELAPTALLEQSALRPMPMIDLDAEPAPAAPRLVIDNDTTTDAVPPRRKAFLSDEELAAWALENPNEVTSNHVRVLRSALQRPAATELLRLSGIDLDALRNLIRAAA